MNKDLLKETIINALYFYQINADYEDQIDCCNKLNYPCTQYIDWNTDTDVREEYFEDIIKEAIELVINIQTED